MSWRPTIAFRAFLVTPSILERRAGRDWSVCVVGPGTGQFYRGSLRGAYLNETLPPAFGSCWTPDESGLLTGPGDCLRPHTAQLVATGWRDDLDPVPAAEVTASCSRIAGRLMDTDDPTRDGQLAITADRMIRLSRTWTGNQSVLGCFVASLRISAAGRSGQWPGGPAGPVRAVTWSSASSAAPPSVPRRLLGVVLVLLVVLGTLVVARWDGRRILGTAAIGRPAGPPTVGDCVAALVGPTPPLFPLVFGPRGRGGRTVGGVLRLRRRARRRGGGVPPDCASATGIAGATSDGQWCTQVAVGYREHLRWQVRAVTGGVWTPVVAHRFVAILGEPVGGTDAGRWAACAVLAPGLEHYRGSYLRSMADTAAPAPFGFCRSGAIPDRRVSCQSPHGEQVFGTAASGAAPALDTCRDLVGRVTGMTDVTGGGRLRVSVAGDGTTVTCRVGVVGPIELTATLTGIGDGPLPLQG